MARVIPLKDDEIAPKDQDWVLVEPGAAGGFFVAYNVATGAQEVAYGRSPAFASAESAINYAEEMATRNRIATIFSKVKSHA